ncbi:alkaline phosphatase family protein [Balneolaceae bacterium ANBcel3]|nr:alkaline phosphatase family protein [Balneolaceae bacterium ANBcel3]
MGLIFVFVDGVGLGNVDDNNPFVLSTYSSFTELSGGHSFTKEAPSYITEKSFFTPIDACLQVEGLPQSGTGQSTLFSGINTSKKLGRHFGPYPHSSIRSFLKEDSLFYKLKKQRKTPCFINAFPEVFFTFSEKRNRWSCTTLMAKSSGIKLNSIEEVLKGRAITAELTQEVWKNKLYKQVPVITEADAAGRVLKAAEQFDLVLMEYYLTDKAGHDRNPDFVSSVLTQFDLFLKVLLDGAKQNGHSLLLTSDHGNVEDISVKTHTLNKVPFYFYGWHHEVFRNIQSIQEVTPLCLEWIKQESQKVFYPQEMKQEIRTHYPG